MCPPPHPCSDPSWFNEAWLGRIQSGAEDNWRLKVGGGMFLKGGGAHEGMEGPQVVLWGWGGGCQGGAGGGNWV